MQLTKLFNIFEIELENRDFRKSLYFYTVDAEKKRKKGLRLGAGIILNQELSYSGYWKKIWAVGTCQRPDIFVYIVCFDFSTNKCTYLFYS